MKRSFVKIRRGGECFWCEVVEPFGAHGLKCRVDNSVGDGLHKLSLNDIVVVKKSEILDVMVG
jgi:hypothetical protein